MRNIEIKNEIDTIEKIDEKINRKDLIYKAGKYKYDSQQYETIRSFSESNYTGKINIDKAKMDQTNLLENMVNFKNNTSPKSKEGQAKKTFDSVSVF